MDHSAPFFDVHSLLTNVGDRANRDIEFGIGRVQLNIAHPVPASRRQIHQLFRLGCDCILTQNIGERQHSIVIGDI